MNGRSPVINPARRMGQIAVEMARVSILGTSGAGQSRQSPPEPSAVTGVHEDGGDIVTALTELDFTDDDHALTI